MHRSHLFAYVVAWSALVATVFLGAGGAGSEGHARATSALQDLNAKQAAFDRLVAQARAGESEPATHISASFAVLEAAAIGLPRHVDLDRHELASHALAGYLDVLRGARRPVDRIAALMSRESAGDAQVRVDIQRPVEAEYKALRRLDLDGACRAVHSGYAASFGARLDDAETYRLALFLITALLLVRLVQSTHEIERRSFDLRAANHTLEGRVEERTRSLSVTNRALESAIEEARRAEQDARVAREAAEAANRTKSSFLAHMSHEIRSPMTAILGFSERLLEEQLSDDDRADAVATIRRNGEHLSQLVSDILDISKIEAGKLGLERVRCSPHRIVAGLQEALASRAAAKGLEFVVAWDGPAPEWILTDPLRVEQVLFNLVGNAIKFTEQGRVSVLARYAPPDEPEGRGRLTFVVEDSGIGMDERALARLFRPFVQATSSTTRRFGGTGLGLSICSRLVAGLGGTIHVASRPGRGSTFSFHVDAGPLDGPLVDAQAISAAARTADGLSAPADLTGMHILLAEDGEDSRRLLRHFLAAAGAEVAIACDGEETVRLVTEARRAGSPFDVVFMDMEMPRLDGYGATQRLRSEGHGLPIVALTANVLVSDRERCLAAGCDDYCAKPVRRAVLVEKALRWRRTEPGEEGAPRGPRAPSADRDEGLLELVRMFVEDLAVDMEAMRQALTEEDLDRLSGLAHRLKGAAGSYGFPEITRQAGLVESAARTRSTRDDLDGELAALEALCAAARIPENPAARAP